MSTAPTARAPGPFDRPVLVSAMQFEDELKSGVRSVCEVIDIAARVGADGIELRRETWPQLDAELAHTRPVASLTPACWSHTPPRPPSSTTPRTVRRQLRQDIDAAAALGAPIVRFFPGQSPPPEDNAAWKRAQEIVDYAAAHDIVIALENYARTPGGTLAEVRQALTRLDSPALRTNLDMGNYPNHGQDVLAAIDSLAAKIIAAHLKDKTANPSDPPTVLGAGLLPLAQILGALDKLPQRIFYIFEFRGGSDPVGRIEHSLAYLHRR